VSAGGIVTSPVAGCEGGSDLASFSMTLGSIDSPWFQGATIARDLACTISQCSPGRAVSENSPGEYEKWRKARRCE